MTTCTLPPSGGSAEPAPVPARREPVGSGDDVLRLARRAALQRYGRQHDVELVADCFDAAAARYRDARVRAYVPLLVERQLREVLQQR